GQALQPLQPAAHDRGQFPCRPGGGSRQSRRAGSWGLERTVTGNDRRGLSVLCCARPPIGPVQSASMKTKLDIATNWLPRYTGTKIEEFGDYILLTNFHDYVERFAERFKCDVRGEGRPMQTATNAHGLTIINFG